jgi:Cu+-exporting ATPase
VVVKDKSGVTQVQGVDGDITKLAVDDCTHIAYVSVNGMTCNSCVKSIETSISKMEGVGNIKVSLEEKEAEIKFNRRVTNGKELAQAIEDIGFEATLRRVVDILTKEDAYIKDKESVEGFSEVQIKILGMTCQSCVKSIEKALSNAAGVKNSRVSLKEERAMVKFNTSITTPEKLRETIEDIGFEAILPKEDSGFQNIMINVQGMTCNSCVNTIETNIAKKNGVQTINVSLEKKQAQISYSPEKTTPKQLVEAINEMGFDAQLLVDGIDKADKDVRMAVIAVVGMTCMSCVNSIEGKMSNAPGVMDIKVSLDLRKADVKYDPAITTPEDLCNAIDEMGFEASLPLKGRLIPSY